MVAELGINPILTYWNFSNQPEAQFNMVRLGIGIIWPMTLRTKIFREM
jgi:hypothetical protein